MVCSGRRSTQHLTYNKPHSTDLTFNSTYSKALERLNKRIYNNNFRKKPKRKPTYTTHYLIRSRLDLFRTQRRYNYEVMQLKLQVTCFHKQVT
jgi:hypothetical protein